MSRVRTVKDDAEFTALMKEAAQKDAKTVVDFNASWCGPCKAIAPHFTSLSQRFSSITFLSVDTEICKAVSAALKITSIPAFQFWVGDQLVKTVVGADKAKLEQAVTLLHEKDKETLVNMAVEDGDVVENAQDVGEQELNDAIDLTRSECLNDTPDHPFGNILKDNQTFCQSDCDEQLLFTIGFRKICSVKTLKFIAPDDGSGPKTVKIFLNKLNMGFAGAEDMAPTASFTLKPGDLQADTPALALDYAKFIKTDTITVFIENNQGDQEQTKLTRLIIWGKKSA